MASLILLRHGKSDWNAPYASDMDRPLNTRGITSAQKMGNWLAETGNLPHRVLCSKALRCKETLRLAMLAGKWSSDILYMEELYEVEALEAFEYLKIEGQKTERLLLVGHEPCLSSLLTLCLGGGRFRFPTSAVAVLESTETDWSKMSGGAFQLNLLVTPKCLTTS